MCDSTLRMYSERGIVQIVVVIAFYKLLTSAICNKFKKTVLRILLFVGAMSVMESTRSELLAQTFEQDIYRGSFHSAKLKKMQWKCPILKQKNVSSFAVLENGKNADFCWVINWVVTGFLINKNPVRIAGMKSSVLRNV